MDQKFTENSENDIDEVNIPEVVDGLQKLAVDISQEESSTSCGQRRSLRKRPPRKHRTLDSLRISMKPRKRSYDDMTTEEQIKVYYLDKTVKRNTNCLETIFEEKEDLTPPQNCMSAKRFKRMIQFTKEPTESKIKKRREKVKRIFGWKKKNLISSKRGKNSMISVINKLQGLQSDIAANPQEVNNISNEVNNG